MAKSERLIPLIIEAKTSDAAISILYEVLKELHLTSDYTDLVALKEKMEYYKSSFRDMSNDYRKIEAPVPLDQVLKFRTDLNFLYRDINDELTFDINRLKIYYDEYKTIQRFESMENLKTDKDVVERYKVKSTSALRDIVGADAKYKEFTSLASVSYGLWQELTRLLDSVKLFTDTLASEAKRATIIEARDVK